MTTLCRVWVPLCVSAGFALLVLNAQADVPPDEVGQVAVLPAVSSHWLWVPDRALRRTALFDGDSGHMLGQIDSGMTVTPKTPLWSKERSEIYGVDTIYSRGHHGERKDFVFVYDARTLKVKGEVEIPARTADSGTGIALVGMLDGDRFLVAFNQSPGSSVSVVDLEERRFVGEVQTAGCAGIFPAGPRRFGMLCGDGSALTIKLTDQGELDGIARSDPFFDPVADPVSEKGARDGARWWFTSFEGFVYAVEFGGDAPAPHEPWSLFTDEERKAKWRVGGGQHLAYHFPTKRLYAVVHQGGPGSHKDPGAKVWVYDTATRKKTGSFWMPNLIVPFIRPQVGFEPDGAVDWLMRHLLPNLGVHSIAVTQDESPLLFARHADLGAVGVLDAMSGEHLRDIEEVGLSGVLLVVP